MPDSPAEPATIPCIPPKNEIIRGRFRASGTSFATPSFASDPELPNQTFFGPGPGALAANRCASSTARGCVRLAAQANDSSAYAPSTARATARCPYPMFATHQPAVRSRYSLPSTSVIVQPLALRATSG